MTQSLKGKPVADRIRDEIIIAVAAFKVRGVTPKLAVIRVGDNPEDIAYETRVLKNCGICGIVPDVHELAADTTTEQLLSLIQQENRDPAVHGILVFRPLPDTIDTDAVSRAVAAHKDVDCMNPENLGKLFVGDPTAIVPCTPEAVKELLLFYAGDLVGKNIVIVNRSLVLGKPLAMLLLAENATVTVCHSRTKDLKEITRKADIVVTGVGKAGYFDREFFGSHSLIADVGINMRKDGNGICGDVDSGSAEGYVAGFSPVPGGIGSITSMLLLRNVVAGAEK